MFNKFRLAMLVGAICVVSFLYSAIGFSQSPAAVRLTTEPPIAQVSPLEAEATEFLGSGQVQPPVQLRLQALDPQGAPLQAARFHLQILTPPPTPWFTTDFPIVEGTTLLELEADAPTGELQLQQVFPIRGTYELQVKVTPLVENAFAPIVQTLSLTVPENPLKYRYFPIVVAVLLAIGFGGGWLIGGRQTVQLGEIAPRRVRLLLSGVTGLAIVALFFFTLSAEFAEAGMPEASTLSDSGVVQSQGLELALTGDRQTAVGQTASLQAALTDHQTNQPVPDAVFNIKATQLENNWVAFAYRGISNADGQFAWQQQFFDGAPHQVEVEVSPSANAVQSFQPFKVTRAIDVEAIAPPLQVRLVGLFYFTIILSLGLVAGLLFQRRRVGLIQ